MNKLKKAVSGFTGLFGGLIGLNTLIKLSGQRLFLPFYHTVANEEPVHIRHLYHCRTEKQFSADIDYMLRHYRPIDAESLYQLALSGQQPEKNTFFLSFDDGLSEVYHIAMPILKEKGIAAAVFINPSFVDNKALFFRYKASILIERISKGLTNGEKQEIGKLLKGDVRQALLDVQYSSKIVLDKAAQVLEVDYNEYLRRVRPYMSMDQLRELQEKGFTIGAHSMDHPQYSQISASDQLQQTEDSLDFVQQHFHEPFRLFAFPFTDHGVSLTFFQQIFSPKKKIADLSFGTAGLKEDAFPTHLQRFPMEGSENAEKLIKTEYLYYLSKIPFGKNKIARN